MAEQSVNAGKNPTLANAKVNEVLSEPEKKIQPAVITAPSDTLVNLPAGFLSPSGEVIRTAEVRELNGKDEEAISRVTGWFRVMGTILSRAVVKIGDLPVDDAMLDRLVIGDRDALLLGVYKATFGPTAVLNSVCGGCGDYKEVEVVIDRDIETKVLVDPVQDRTFTVNGAGHEYLLTLPTGVVQRELGNNSDRTNAELTTLMLEQCVVEIDGSPVLGKSQVQALGLADRRKLANEIAKRAPGPQFETAEVDCPDCGGKVAVPINLGTLFRF